MQTVPVHSSQKMGTLWVFPQSVCREVHLSRSALRLSCHISLLVQSLEYSLNKL